MWLSSVERSDVKMDHPEQMAAESISTHELEKRWKEVRERMKSVIYIY
jgi:hypothetical protein